MLKNEMMDKDPNMVPEHAPVKLLDSKPSICVAKNGKDTKHIRYISRSMHLVRNGE